MMYIMTWMLVMLVITSAESFELNWEIAKCLTSKPALFLTYLSSMTGTRYYAFSFCTKKMRAFRKPFLGAQ